MINSIKTNLIQNSTISFRGPLRKFDLVRVDNVPCVYCGEKMLSLSNFDKALEDAKSLGRMFQVGKNYEKFLDEAEFFNLNFPFLVSNPKGFKFALRNLFMPHVSTIDHIIPKSEGGLDDISNYAAACYRCNSGRNSTDISQMLRHNPEIAENIQKHIDYLKSNLPDLIKTRKVGQEYKSYPQILAQSLMNASKGKLDIKV